MTEIEIIFKQRVDNLQEIVSKEKHQLILLTIYYYYIMKIITTTGSFTSYNEFSDSSEGFEKAKVYLAKQITNNGSKNWSIIRGDRATSETLFSSLVLNDRKLMDQLVTMESRKQVELAVSNLC